MNFRLLKTLDFIKRKCQGKHRSQFISDVRVKNAVIAYMARKYRRNRGTAPLTLNLGAVWS
jgi:hypothetical protein